MNIFLAEVIVNVNDLYTCTCTCIYIYTVGTEKTNLLGGGFQGLPASIPEQYKYKFHALYLIFITIQYDTLYCTVLFLILVL